MEKEKLSENQQNRKTNNEQGRSGLNDYLKYTGMGMQMLAIIAIFTWAGRKLDQRSQGDKPIFTAIFALAGVIIGIYTVLKDFIHIDHDR